MNLNKAMLIGNLTRDPEVKNTPNGTPVASFSVATNYVWKDANGQKQERAEFHNIVTWRKLAEICGQYLHKGSKVYIEGRMQTRDWVGQDNVKRYRMEIVADNMIMLDRAGVRNATPSMPEEPPMPASSPTSEPVIDVNEPVAENNNDNNNNSADDDIKIENIPF